MNAETSPSARTSPLPYRDTKAVGAADFYFAINATFRFILERFGEEGLRRYWFALGSEYYAPLMEAWKKDGLPEIAAYWRAFFTSEPGGEVTIEENASEVVVNVSHCPAIQHLRAHGREIVPCFCQHCYFISEAIAAPAGFAIRVVGGNGSCRQTIGRRDGTRAAQRIDDIHQVTGDSPC
jgi:hypothetical protein